jgi:CRISPR-associated protein Cas1
MSSRWRVVDLVNFSGRVAVTRGRLLINEIEIPFSDVSCILTGPRTHWNGALVTVATEFDVPLIACDWRNVPIAVLNGWSDNTRVGARHQAQANLSLPRKKNAWMRIVKAKIHGQAQNFSAGSDVADKLNDYARQVKSGDPTNLEATAARLYWTYLFDGEPFFRERGGDGRNAFLNYGYTVLRGSVVRSIVVSGLMPSLGIWHGSRSNAFALADDLIEPFRPAVDAVVKGLPEEADLSDRAIKEALVGVTSLPMDVSGETVGSSLTSFCQRVAQYVEGESDVLHVPVWRVGDG